MDWLEDRLVGEIDGVWDSMGLGRKTDIFSDIGVELGSFEGIGEEELV